MGAFEFGESIGGILVMVLAFYFGIKFGHSLFGKKKKSPKVKKK